MTRNEVIASVLGSFAASVECERDGNIPVSRDDVRKKMMVSKHMFQRSDARRNNGAGWTA